ncbi:cell division protein ZapA [Sagittula sp. NFXS13]|uniref:cell division protein ZapA n=1 Tax=Sagittula sp. NFXS13 TaxID=2819095 RepID=UPI0032DE6AE1
MSQIEVDIHIGERVFQVACQEGEQAFLQSAAALLDAEAQVLVEQIGRIPEGRMLLMAGLMLADKTAGLEEKLREAEGQMQALRAEVEALKSAPKPEPERVEVPVIPSNVSDALADIAARTESLAEIVDEKLRA